MRNLNRKAAALLLTAAMATTVLAGTALAAGPDGPGGPGGPGGPSGPGGFGSAPAVVEPVYQGPKLTVEGEIYGTANSNGGSCIVVEGNTDPIQYESGVTLVLTQDGLDDSKIDSSNAKVELVAGDGYGTEICRHQPARCLAGRPAELWPKGWRFGLEQRRLCHYGRERLRP